MNFGKMQWKFHLVGNLSSFGKNVKETNVTRSQLALDTELMGTLERCNLKVSHLVNFKGHNLMMAIILALLTRLGCFQLFTNNANLLFCILDHIRTKELPLSGF